MRVVSWINSIGRIGFKPEDTDEERIKKSTLTILAPFAWSGIILGVLYFLNGLVISGFIPFTYGILSLLSFLHFAITKKYTFFRNSQLSFVLILPFLLQLSLGGFVHGSAVIIWALISPVGALVFFKTKNAIFWFISYLFLLFIAWLANDYLYQFVEIKTTENFINALFLLNLAAVSSLIFAIQYSYVKKQNELKKAIESRNEKLKEMDNLKTRFFANISHEFRTPLTIILGLANKQIQNTNAPPQVTKDNLTIKSNANRLLELINQLLDISKLESGEEKLELREDDLVSCVKHHYGMFESLAKSKKQLLLFNGKKYSDHVSDAPVITFFDHEKMQKIITNLLANAVKFTPEEGIIDVSVNKDENNVYLEVSNTGVEIEPEAIPHLFDRFYQVNSESTREHEGTGIGLALVKELIDIHLGAISVESNHNKTCFKIKLPAEYDEEIKRAEAQKKITSSLLLPEIQTINVEENTAQQLPETDENRLVVLIVEDNPDLRNLIRSILEDTYTIMVAGDGLEGFETATEHVPDLIVTDVMMPKMDGLQLCFELKNQQKTCHIPVVMLTAKASLENKIEGLQQGADEYLIKPFEKSELLARIKNLIEIRKSLQENFQGNLWSRPAAEKKTNLNDAFLHNVKEITEKNLDNSLFGVEDLAKEIGMSRSQVHRKLRALTNKSATLYIKNYRLYRAAELLDSTTDTISEIAYQVGFSSQTYFSSSFRELHAKTPSEYREN